MIGHILVPLDGTKLAEAALPPAAALAGLLAAKITLLHLVEKDASPEIHGERHLTEAGEAQCYLDDLRRRVLPPALKVECHVHSPAVTDVAGGIVAHRRELNPDLIVMCTHGPMGFERLLRGSLAQQVVALGKTPLLLVHSEFEEERGPFTPKRLLVPLDGIPEHEAGLELACDLAAAARGRLHLVSVVASTPFLAGRQATLSRFMPGTTQVLQEITAANLQSYLEKQVGRFGERGIETTAEIGYGETTEIILKAAESFGADLIVLATHGKVGSRAFWANSAAARVQGKTSRPLLLVPV
jgi:nucleotide-binding universal stress UspA family protein